MSNMLTGGCDAVLGVRRATLRRLLAAMHEHGGQSTEDDLPNLPHGLRIRIGDDDPLDGVRGRVQAQLGVPQIELASGTEVGPLSSAMVAAAWPVRAWFRPDPGTAAFPPFAHGVLKTTFTVALENQPAGPALRFTPAGAVFTSNELASGPAAQVATQALHFLQHWSAESPFVLMLGALDFPLRARSVGDAIAVALPLPQGQPQPATLVALSQDFTQSAGPADFAIAVSREYILGLIQPFLDQIKASHPTFEVDPSWPLPDSTYTVHVKKAVASWTGSGATATIKLSLEGDATTPTILPNADWDVSLAFHLGFDAVAQTLVLTAAGDPNVDVDVHGPAGGLVEGGATMRVRTEVKNARDAALPQIQAAVGAALPAQIARFKGLLLQLTSYVTVSITGADFGPHGIVLGGSVGMPSRTKAPQVTIDGLPDASGYTAFSNWLPGGWITEYRWLWASWTIDPATGEPTLQPVPGPLPGTQVWPHEQKTFKDRFVVRQGEGIDLPGLGAAEQGATHWEVCLYVAGTQVDPRTGQDAGYPLDPWGKGLPQPKPLELVTSLQDAMAHPGWCGIGGTGTPVRYAWRHFVRWMQPDPAIEKEGLWVEQTWLDHDPQSGGGTFVGHLDLLADAGSAAGMPGRAAVFHVLGEESPEAALQVLGDAFRSAEVAPGSFGVYLLIEEGTRARFRADSAAAIRSFARAVPGIEVRVLEDFRGSWSRVLRTPARRAAVRVFDADFRVAFVSDGRLDVAALSRALGGAGARRDVASAGPLTPISGPGRAPRDLRIETGPAGSINLRHLRGRPLVLGFARAWSDPCLAVLHELRTAHPEMARRRVVVAGILTGADAELSATFQARQRLPFPVIADGDAAIARACGIQVWPTIVWMEGGDRQYHLRCGATSAAMKQWANDH